MQPTYSLEKVKKLIRQGKFNITRRALKEAAEIFDYEEINILNEILEMDLSSFKKTMESNSLPGLFQDVYKKTIVSRRTDAYIKLQIFNGESVIISFHQYD